MNLYRRILNLIVAVMLSGGLVVPMITHDAPMGGWTGTESEIAQSMDERIKKHGYNLPTFHKCEVKSEYPRARDSVFWEGMPAFNTFVVADRDCVLHTVLWEDDTMDRINATWDDDATPNGTRADNLYVVGILQK